MQHSIASPLHRPTDRAVTAAFDAPLAGLSGTSLARRFRHWHGVSGRRHLFSVFPITGPQSVADAPRFEDAVVLAVGRDMSGERRILAMDRTGGLPDLVYESARFRAAIADGADEIHVHLLADDTASRAAVLKDLDIP